MEVWISLRAIPLLVLKIAGATLYVQSVATLYLCAIFYLVHGGIPTLLCREGWVCPPVLHSSGFPPVMLASTLCTIVCALESDDGDGSGCIVVH